MLLGERTLHGLRSWGGLVNSSPASSSWPWKRPSGPLIIFAGLGCILGLAGCGGSQSATSAQQSLVINWNNVTVTSKTTPSLQVVVNPPLQPGKPLGDSAYKFVSQLGPDYMRYAGWFPYPRLSVAELQPPTSLGTSWDFTLIDPMVNEFLTATQGHPTVMSLSTIPQWMFITDAPVTYPDDPGQVAWNYEQGTALRDPTCQELGDYYHRLASWYVDGGFSDENGEWHTSGHHYHLPIWEVFNEVDFEHSTSKEDYTTRYDAVVEGVHSASPDTKFMGMALASPSSHLDFIQYFLNPANHKPGIPIDYISYHFYAIPATTETVDTWQYTFFAQAESFLNSVRSIETIRKGLSPQTRTDIDELGTILPTDNTSTDSVPPPAAYWNLSGAMFAYMYVELAKMQIDVVGESQLVGFPSQFPSVSMMDWQNNQPNARFWVLKLLKDNFHPGDQLVETDLLIPNAVDLEAQAFVTPSGHKLLLINKRNRAINLPIPDAANATATTVDPESGEGPARSVSPIDGSITLQPFAVTVVTW